MVTSMADLKLYYSSGTGNSYRVSKWIEEKAIESGMGVSLESVYGKKVHGFEGDILGIVFPTHGFTAPWNIIKFALKLPKNKIPFFVVSTRAGLRFGNLFLQGISGSAFFVVAMILLIKGYRLKGMISIDMPSNWYSLHPIQREKSTEAIIEKAEIKTDKFVKNILSNKKVLFTNNILYEGFWAVLLSWISVLYLCFGRFFLAKLFFANNRCTGCSICAERCSMGAIDMRGNEIKRPYWKFSCESCMKCGGLCPENAIEAGHSWGALLYYLSTIKIAIHLKAFFEISIPDFYINKIPLVATMFNFLYMFVSIYIAYHIFSVLIRVPYINKIFSVTTLTHIPKWGRYFEKRSKKIFLKRKK